METMFLTELILIIIMFVTYFHNNRSYRLSYDKLNIGYR